jgi:hypothetical protein
VIDFSGVESKDSIGAAQTLHTNSLYAMAWDFEVRFSDDFVVVAGLTW